MGLTATKVKGKLDPGAYGDGDGLWLMVKPSGRRTWVFRFMLRGKAAAMGLGSIEDVTLADARDQAAQHRKLLREGINPIDQRRAAIAAKVLDAAKGTTFSQAADMFIASHEAAWKNGGKSAAQWRASLQADAYPKIGKLPVGKIGVEDVLGVLNPIWRVKTETASRLRSRIEQIIAYATVRGWRSNQIPNPAVWRNNLSMLLPSPAKIAAVEHHTALDWQEAPAFMAKLSSQRGIGALALAFAVLTAARSGEVRGAVWEEIDLEAALWTIPAERMKANRQHRVPLSAPALALLKEVAPLRRPGGFIFPGRDPRKALSDMSLTAVLRRMKRGEITAHGFRSTFSTWVAEMTSHPSNVAEQALAHSIGTKVEQAYRRGDLFEQRTILMNDWATYLTTAPAACAVVSIRRASAPAASQASA